MPGVQINHTPPQRDPRHDPHPHSDRARDHRLRLDYRCSALDVAEYDEVRLDRPTRISVNGPYVAAAFYSTDDVGDDYTYDTIVWAKLGGNPDVRRVVASGLGTVVDRLYASKTGALAYSARLDVEDTGETDPELTPRVGYIPPIRRGRPTDARKLDKGKSLATKSLRVSGSQITWKNAGQIKTAPWK